MEQYNILPLLETLNAQPDIFICGPSYGNNKLRVYAYGGVLCRLPTTASATIDLLSEDYLQKDSPLSMILNGLKGNEEKEKFLREHLDDLLSCMQKRFTSKSGDCEERSQQTAIARAHTDFDQHSGTVVCDYEFALPQAMSQANFDLVTFSPSEKIFTFVEYKCNADACKDEKSGLKKHTTDMLNCMNNSTASDWCKKELLRRLSYMCTYDLLKNCPDELKCVSPDLRPEDLDLRAAFLFTPGAGLKSCPDAAELCKKHIPKDDLDKFSYYFAESPKAVDLSSMESWGDFCNNQ